MGFGLVEAAAPVAFKVNGIHNDQASFAVQVAGLEGLLYFSSRLTSYPLGEMPPRRPGVTFKIQNRWVTMVICASQPHELILQGISPLRPQAIGYAKLNSGAFGSVAGIEHGRHSHVKRHVSREMQSLSHLCCGGVARTSIGQTQCRRDAEW